MTENRVMLSDSYKYSHADQYPSNMVAMYNYMESRGGIYPATKFFGLQYYLKKYFSIPITLEEVIEAHAYAEAHGIPFDLQGWLYIVKTLNGKLPVKIKAVPEGSLIPTGNVLMTIESTDPIVPWVPGWLETILMKVWYPTTIATKSHHVKQILLKYGSEDWAKFAYHNFGDRDASSIESAAIGGLAHLSAGFNGTDNFNCLRYASEYYGSNIAAYSIFVSEHSTTTSYGREDEEQFVYDQLLKNPDAPIMSFVADSYNVYNFVDFCTRPDSRIRKLIESRPHQKLILRPDSGKPTEVLPQILFIMIDNKLNHTIDKNGRTLFTDFGILWGDGITPFDIDIILTTIKGLGYAAENFVFGSGGDLMQNLTRNTCKFAIKCSSIGVDEGSAIDTGLLRYFDGESVEETVWEPFIIDIDVYKDPITDPGKTSKKGRVTTYYNPVRKEYFTDKIGRSFDGPTIEALKPVYLNGELLIDDTLDVIRGRN